LSLQSQVVEILTGPVVARIRFRFPLGASHVTIAPQTFYLVARAIHAGHVHIQRPTDLAQGVYAQYNDVARTRTTDGTVVPADTLEVNAASGRFDQATVVHESLHAAYDLLRTGIDANAEEASACLTTALYCLMTGLPTPRWAGSLLWANAVRTARTLLAQYQIGNPGIPMVGQTEWEGLRLAVSLDGTYRWETAGILGVLVGAQYTHDG
jgi:hypothetical protein